MEVSRRSFLGNLFVLAGATLAKGPVGAAAKVLGPKPVPSALFVSVSDKRPAYWKAVIASGNNAAAKIQRISDAISEAGKKASRGLRKALRTGANNTFVEPLLRPSLRNILPPHAVR